MPRYSQLEAIELNLLMQRGHNAFWKIILNLDLEGVWSLSDVQQFTDVSCKPVRDFVMRLVAGGIAEEVKDEGRTGRFFRLLQRPAEAPRLRRDGSVCPELQTNTLWRTMKMAKVFTVSELAALASTDNRSVKLATTKSYIEELANVGILVRVSKGGSKTKTHYRLVRNLGAHAPKVLRTHIIFDPNSNTVIGKPVAHEVQS